MENSGTTPREISRCLLFIKGINWKVIGTLTSLKYNVTPFPSGGLEAPVGKFYRFEYSGDLHSTDDTNSNNDNNNDYHTITFETEDAE